MRPPPATPPGRPVSGATDHGVRPSRNDVHVRDLDVGEPEGDDRTDAETAAATFARVDPAADAVETLYREKFVATARLAFLLTGDSSAADDLAQEAFARLYRDRAAIQNQGAFLRTALVNLCHDHRRREDTAKRVRPAPIGNPLVGARDDDPTTARRLRLSSGGTGSAGSTTDGGEPGGGVPRSVDATWLAVQALPDRRRDAVVLRYYADLPADEIARLLDCRPATVRSLLKRGLDSLKEVLTDER